MSKQSVEQILKDVIEASNAKTVALTEQLQKLAGANSNYTERLQKMEENLTSAMQKVLEMDSNIKDFHKTVGSKVDDMEAKFASWWKNNEEDMDKPDNWDDMTEDEQQEWIDMHAKKEVAKVAKSAEANVIDGVNPTVVTGQPNPTKDGEPTEPINKKKKDDEETEEAAEAPYKAKKGKKAGKLKIEHEGEVEIENESEEGEEEESEESENKTVIKGKKALERDVVKPDNREITAEPVDEDAAEQTEKVEKKLGKKATHKIPGIHKGEPVDETIELDQDAADKQDELVKPLGKKAKKAGEDDMKDGDTISNPPVNKKYDEETECAEDEACDDNMPKSKKGKKADETEQPEVVAAAETPAPVAQETVAPAAVEEKPAVKAAEAQPAPSAVADVAKIVESVSGKIEAAYEKLASATMKQAAAETRVTEGAAEIAALKAKAEREEAEKVAALEAAKTLAMEVKAQSEAAVAMKALEAKLAEMTAKLAQLESADKSAEMKAAKMVASTGITEAVEAAPVVSAEQTDDDVFAQFEKLTGKEQRAYYLANKQVIERVAFRNTKNRFR